LNSIFNDSGTDSNDIAFDVVNEIVSVADCKQ